VLIEINLAPGGAAVRSKRLSALKVPSLPSLADAKAIAGAGVGVLVIGLAIFGYSRMTGHRADLQARIEQEVADSARYATASALLQALQARQDSIAQKIQVIRAVDTKRYVWPHLLDEISIAVPAYTWINEISSTEVVADSLNPNPGTVFTIQGSAGSTMALTRFMKNLEGSAFINEVTLITTEQKEEQGRTIQSFSLEADYQIPEEWAIRTVPLVTTLE
jgi:Tfp pilus assembly protein PilN